MLIVWFRLYLQQSLIQNTMQTTKREARRNSVNIMDNKHGVGDIICHAHIFLPKMWHKLFGTWRDVFGTWRVAYAFDPNRELKNTDWAVSFLAFQYHNKIVSLSVRLRVRPPNCTKLRVPCKEGVSGAGFKRTVSCSVRPLYHTKLRVPCKD